MLFSQMCEVDQSMNNRKSISNWRARIGSISKNRSTMHLDKTALHKSHQYSLQVNSGPVHWQILQDLKAFNHQKVFWIPFKSQCPSILLQLKDCRELLRITDITD